MKSENVVNTRDFPVPSPAAPANPASGKTLRTLPARFFGYDFFISFKLGPPPIGAQSYASDLARRLRELDFTVFFSEEEAAPGAQLDSTLTTALHRSSILIVVVNEGALLNSVWVRKEVEEFRRKHPKRPVIPINVDSAIETFGPRVDLGKWLGYEGRIWLNETAAALADGITSSEVVQRLAIAPGLFRVNRVWRGLQIAVFAIISTLVVIAWREADNATRQAQISRSHQLAAQAQVDLDKRPKQNLLTALESISVSQAVEDFSAIRSGQLLTNILTQTGGLSLDHSSPPADLAFSPDDRWLLTASQQGLRRWDLQAPDKPAVNLGDLNLAVDALAFSPDGRVFASADRDAAVRLWNIDRPTAPVKTLPAEATKIVDIQFSPDGQWLATAAEDGKGQLWNLHGAEPRRISLPNTQAVAFSPDSHWLAIGSQGGQIAVRKLNGLTPSSAPERTFAVPLAVVRKLVFDPKGTWLAAAGKTDSLLAFLLPMTTRDQALELEVQQWSVNSLAFSPDGQWVVTPNAYNVRLWNLAQADLPPDPITLRGHTSETLSAVFSKTGDWLATGNADFTTRLWNMRDRYAPPIVLRGHEGGVTQVVFSHNNRWLATAGTDNSVRLWNVSAPTAQPLALKTDHDGAQLNVWDIRNPASLPLPRVLGGDRPDFGGTVVSADGRWVAEVSNDTAAAVTLWDLASQPPKAFVLHRGGQVWASPVFSPDNRWLITGGVEDPKILLWDLSVPDPSASPKVLGSHGAPIRSFAISADGHRLVSGGRDGFAKIWDLSPEASSSRPILLQAGDVKAVAISKEGRYVVAGSWGPDGSTDHPAFIWDLTSKTSAPDPIAQLHFKGRVFDVAISGDGHWAGVGSLDGTAQVLDLRKPASAPIIFQGQPGREFGWILSVAFSPDSRQFVTGHTDRIARIWNLEVDDPTYESVVLEAPEKVGSLSFSRDGQWLALGKTEFRTSTFSGDSAHFASSSPETWLYHTRLDDLTRLACQIAGHSLSATESQHPGRKVCEQLDRAAQAAASPVTASTSTQPQPSSVEQGPTP